MFIMMLRSDFWICVVLIMLLVLLFRIIVYAEWTNLLKLSIISYIYWKDFKCFSDLLLSSMKFLIYINETTRKRLCLACEQFSAAVPCVMKLVTSFFFFFLLCMQLVFSLVVNYYIKFVLAFHVAESHVI